MGRLVLNHSTNIEGLIPILQKLALENNIKTITPAVISRARGRSSKLIIRLSVKTINGYKAIARKGKTAQEVFISTDLSKDELKKIIEAILASIKRVFFVSLLLFIILYIYATMGSILFGEDDPERWADLGISLITLFQVLTLSSWENVMLPMQAIYWWAWIYFFSFISICSITILNLVIAILVDVVNHQK